MSDKKNTKPAAAAKTAAKPAASTKAVAKTPAKAPAKKIVKKLKKGDNPRAQFNILYANKKRVFGTAHGVHPSIDMSNFVRWPRYIQVQRRRRILMRRFKVPPTINQFTRVLDKNTATNVFKLLDKYRPEERSVKRARLLAAAKERAAAPKGTKTAAPKDKVLVAHHGVDLVTRLVEKKKAKLVVIAHDVDPIELVIFLPTLCRRMDVPYCIVKSKARLGQVVNMKKTSVVALTGVNTADTNDLALITESVKAMYNNNSEHRKQWGGNQLSNQSKVKMAKKLKLKEGTKKATA